MQYVRRDATVRTGGRSVNVISAVRMSERELVLAFYLRPTLSLPSSLSGRRRSPHPAPARLGPPRRAGGHPLPTRPFRRHCAGPRGARASPCACRGRAARCAAWRGTLVLAGPHRAQHARREARRGSHPRTDPIRTEQNARQRSFDSAQHDTVRQHVYQHTQSTVNVNALRVLFI